MSSSLVELRPNRRLLDHEFEGYKLNLQALPHYSLELTNPVDRMLPDDAYYSFVHAKIFALHNHLILDYWDHSFSFYYVDNNQQIRRITFENVNHTFHDKIVYDIPAHMERKSGHFNLCLAFPSCNLAVVSDGTGYLHIVDTGQRNRATDLNQMWNTLQSSLILGENKYFIIVDARLYENDGKETLHCLLQSVEQNEKHFNSVLSWVSFDFDGSWKQTSFRQIQGKGTIHYAALETNCTALYIASDNIFKFTMDSEREIKEPSSEDFKKIIYIWLQTSDDVTVTLKLEENFDKKNLNIIVTPNILKVSYADKAFVEGSLRYKVDSELTTWNVQENGQIDILITKSESILWDELLEGGDPNGEQIMDPSLVEETHRRLAHLCSETEVSSDRSVPGLSTQELEDCDTVSEEDTVLVRIDVINHQVTHRIPLSVHQFLCSIKMETQEVPALALRHDVDACIWQPYAQLINSDTWPVKHQGTLMAFGYIQSSKQNRKFVTCPPNFSYSVVCESSRHIFIYQSISNQDCQLRKRTSGVMKNIKVGQQHVFNIDKYGEVLGINATNEFLFILTESLLIAIKIH